MKRRASSNRIDVSSSGAGSGGILGSRSMEVPSGAAGGAGGGGGGDGHPLSGQRRASQHHVHQYHHSGTGGGSGYDVASIVDVQNAMNHTNPEVSE